MPPWPIVHMRCWYTKQIVDEKFNFWKVQCVNKLRDLLLCIWTFRQPRLAASPAPVFTSARFIWIKIFVFAKVKMLCCRRSSVYCIYVCVFQNLSTSDLGFSLQVGYLSLHTLNQELLLVVIRNIEYMCAAASFCCLLLLLEFEKYDLILNGEGKLENKYNKLFSTRILGKLEHKIWSHLYSTENAHIYTKYDLIWNSVRSSICKK